MQGKRVRAKFLRKELPATVEEWNAVVCAVAAFAMGEENAKVFFAENGHVGGYRDPPK